MKYYKEVTTGAVVKAGRKPNGRWWREATEGEYLAYHRMLDNLMNRLDGAIAYKKRLLGVRD